MTSLTDDGADYVALLLSGRGMSVDSHIVSWKQIDPWEVRGIDAPWCHRSARVASKVLEKTCPEDKGLSKRDFFFGKGEGNEENFTIDWETYCFCKHWQEKKKHEARSSLFNRMHILITCCLNKVAIDLLFLYLGLCDQNSDCDHKTTWQDYMTTS